MAKESIIPLGKLIQDLRKKAMLSKEALAERADISTNALDRLERGVTRKPQPETLKGIAKALNLKGDELKRFEHAILEIHAVPNNSGVGESDAAQASDELCPHAQEQGGYYGFDGQNNGQRESLDGSSPLVENYGKKGEEDRAQFRLSGGEPLETESLLVEQAQPLASAAFIGPDPRTRVMSSAETYSVPPIADSDTLPLGGEGEALTLSHLEDHPPDGLATKARVALGALVVVGAAVIGLFLLNRLGENNGTKPRIATTTPATGSYVLGIAPALAAATETALVAQEGSNVLERLWLDTWHAAGYDTSYGVRGTVPITDGQKVIVGVRGTYSVWSKSWWKPPLCKGMPEQTPQYLTEGFTGENPNGPVGLDAQYAFAAPANASYCTRGDNPPYSSQSPFQISVDGGTNWLDPAPFSSSYAADHAYTYEVDGQGELFLFRIKDHTANDNYGRLRIVIRIP